ncbi:MAG TPA: sigma-70 family RNA polymerase sigma factor [Vicinamibacterales bacterium]|nr:sigma-70 family RNA polymerase sigma factor [Vicinamibacterales bacterium]
MSTATQTLIEAAHDSRASRVAADDVSVVEALRRGDEGAFARLVDHNRAGLRRVARLYVSNRAVADEVVQDTWLGVIQGIWAFEGRSSLKTWIFRILINHAKTRAARERRTVPFARFDAEVDAVDAAVAPDRLRPEDDPIRPPRDLGASPERRLLVREAREQLRNAIEALPENQRRVLVLRDVEGRSTEEVCHTLGIHGPNVRVLLHRARAKVRAALAPYLTNGHSRPVLPACRFSS